MMRNDPFQTLLALQASLDMARTGNWLGVTGSSASAPIRRSKS